MSESESDLDSSDKSPPPKRHILPSKKISLSSTGDSDGGKRKSSMSGEDSGKDNISDKDDAAEEKVVDTHDLLSGLETNTIYEASLEQPTEQPMENSNNGPFSPGNDDEYYKKNCELLSAENDEHNTSDDTLDITFLK